MRATSGVRRPVSRRKKIRTPRRKPGGGTGNFTKADGPDGQKKPCKECQFKRNDEKKIAGNDLEYQQLERPAFRAFQTCKNRRGLLEFRH
ncbi:hypothetical protein QW131_18585 [Roseibium salinum]|nr:hypothetical protein [Roseibium salinum]